MQVTLKFKKADGKCYKCKRKLTVKQATDNYKKHLKNDKNIVKVWLIHFDGWWDRRYKILKKENNEK